MQKTIFRCIFLFFIVFPCVPASLEMALSELVCAQSQLMGSLTFGIASEQGKRSTMEDAHSVVIGDGYGWYALFDGHGGADIAQLAAKTLHAVASDVILKKKLDFSFLFTLFNEFLDSDPERKNKAHEQGSTAVIALIQDDILTVANLGDSRAVLCSGGKAVRITIDHKPTDPSEQERIEKISQALVDKKGEFCAVTDDGRIVSERRGAYSLGVSRALGDKTYQPCVSYIPDVFTRKITPNDQFLVLACDGLWDMMSDDQVVQFVGDRLKKSNPQEIAQDLCEEALVRWRNTKGSDNVTIIIVTLPPLPG